LKRKPRYSILQVTLAVTACCIVLLVTSFIAVILSPAEANLKASANMRSSFIKEIIFIAVSNGSDQVAADPLHQLVFVILANGNVHISTL